MHWWETIKMTSVKSSIWNRAILNNVKHLVDTPIKIDKLFTIYRRYMLDKGQLL